MARPRKKLLIVDGYNAIRSGSRYRNIQLPDFTDDYFNVARQRLLNDVIDYAGRGMEAIVVYDAADRKGDASKTETVGGVRVMFSAMGQTADHLIEKLAHDARERGVETIVVTSDATIQDTVFGGGIDRMSAEGFCRAVAGHYESAHVEEAYAVAHKNTVASRIPAATLEKLKRLRDEGC